MEQPQLGSLRYMGCCKPCLHCERRYWARPWIAGLQSAEVHICPLPLVIDFSILKSYVIFRFGLSMEEHLLVAATAQAWFLQHALATAAAPAPACCWLHLLPFARPARYGEMLSGSSLCCSQHYVSGRRERLRGYGHPSPEFGLKRPETGPPVNL